MTLFFRSLPRLWRKASLDLKRHFAMTFSASLSIGIALLMAMLLLISAANIANFTQHIEQELMIQVSLQPTLDASQQENIQQQLVNIQGVKNVTYSSKEEELDKLIQENGDIFAQYAQEGRNPLYNVFLIEADHADQIETISKKAKTIHGVIDVSYGGGAIQKLIALFKNVRIWGTLFVALMILLAIYLIRNTIKMTIHVRKDEIAIMRQVGAYNWFITVPFVLEGMIIGLRGALIPALIAGIGYPLLYQTMNGVFLSDMFILLSPIPFILYLVAFLLLLGLGAGLVGSYLAVKKYVRFIR